MVVETPHHWGVEVAAVPYEDENQVTLRLKLIDYNKQERTDLIKREINSTLRTQTCNNDT